MILNKIVLFIFNYFIIIAANETNIHIEQIGTSEISICENSTTDCYSEHITDAVPFFVTNSSMEHSTASDVVTEFTGIVTTSTFPSPPLIENKQEDNSLIEKPCNCDSTIGVCNINCCCDMDCNKWERDAFSDCITSKPVLSTGHCISTSIIYKNNTPFPIVKSEDGFLCISKDNFPERNWFLEQGIIRSERMFEKIWQRKRHFYWKLYHPPQLIKFMNKDIYKYGDPIWLFSNSTNEVEQLTYPIPLTASSICGQQKTILYLQNFESNCLENIPLTEEQCLSHGFYQTGKHYFGQFFIASPSLINNTNNLEESPDEAFNDVRYEFCEENECNVADRFPVPEFNSLTYNCKNVVTRVELEVRHNGSRGITEVKCRISLSSTGPQEPLFKRMFRVKFLSSHQSNSSVVFKRSGTPGYRVGLPVITGFLQGDQVIKKSYLTVASGPNCSGSTEILFGENSRTQCILQVPIESTYNCTRLAEEIAILLLSHMTGDMIGANGDPDTWLKRPIPIPIRLRPLSVQEPCSVETSLSLDFLYSYSGPLWQPTANIIGLSSAFTGKRYVDCSTSLFVCSVRLNSIISFTDVSKPALGKFATPPVVKIKLPHDFFYPFSASHSSQAVHHRRQIAMIVISICSIILQVR